MRTELIKTKNYLLVVGDEAIKEGDWYRTPLDIYSQFNGTEKLIDGTLKVICHLPLNGAPYLDGVAVLPEIENTEILQYISKHYYKVNSLDELNGELLAVADAIINTKETYRYTEEDMMRAFIEGTNVGAQFEQMMDYDSEENDEPYEFAEEAEKEFKESLNQPKLPIAFESEHTGKCCGNSLIEHCIQCDNYKPIPKTITTVRGTEWVGKYLF